MNDHSRPQFVAQAPITRRPRRAGLTLAELLVATTIMIMIAGAMATLTMTVHATNSHCRGQAVAAQHGRVALQRIEQAVLHASANEQFPGALVVPRNSGGSNLPEALVVWCPPTPGASSTGLPPVNELVVFSPDPSGPHRLLEVRAPSDSSTAPAADNESAWRSLVADVLASASSDRIVLTDRLRAVPLSGTLADNPPASDLRGAVRFSILLAPDADEWQSFREGNLDWDQLSWPLDSYRTSSGTRRVVCQTELQIVPGDLEAASGAAVPLFGSASISYELLP